MSYSFSSLSPDELSQLIPAYEVLELISISNQGAIYEAQQRSLSRMVTIKVMPPEIGQSESLQAAFATEAKAMARLNHPNLVNVFDFGNIEGMLYIIMEHIPKRNLNDITEGHHVDQSEATRLVADICHGLAHAHEQGILHRNLTPSSILINDNAEPKIIDFGISELTGQDESTENTAYHAPEITASAPADIYAVGVILYRLLTGHFYTDFETYTAPSEIVATNAALDEITAIALQTEPQMRYQKASDMASDLEEYIEHHISTPEMAPANPTPLLAATPAPTAPITSNQEATYSGQPSLSSATSHGSVGKAAIVFILIAIGAIVVILLSLTNRKEEPIQANTPETPGNVGLPATTSDGDSSQDKQETK